MNFKLALMTIAGATLANTLTFGTYGYLTEKKKYSSWKAGAATGAISGALAAGMVLLMAPNAGQAQAPANGAMSGVYAQRLRGLTMSSLPKGIGLLASQKLGCPAC